MTWDRGLLVSAPAVELAGAALPGSVFGAQTLEALPISAPLRRAIRLLKERTPESAPLKFVARPEIFTDGVSLDWLMSRCQGIGDHVALSDGSAVRLVPGMRNHVFFYNQSDVSHAAALARLARRVPETLAQTSIQINTAFRFDWEERVIAPKTLVLSPTHGDDAGEARLVPLLFNRHSLEDGAMRMAESDVGDAAQLCFARGVYIPLTTTALADVAFAKTLAARVARAYFEPKAVLILGAPDLRDPTAPAVERMLALTKGLFAGGKRIPPAATTQVLVALGDLGSQALALIAPTWRLVAHRSHEFWRQPSSFYESFSAVEICALSRSLHLAAFRNLVGQGYGVKARIRWMAAPFPAEE